MTIEAEKENLIATAKNDLDCLELQYEYWSQKKKITTGERRKFAHENKELLKKIINAKTAELLALNNHVFVTPEIDARDKYIEQVEAENKEKDKQIKDLQNKIKIMEDLAMKQ